MGPLWEPRARRFIQSVSVCLSDRAADQILDEVSRGLSVCLSAAFLHLYQDHPKHLPVSEITRGLFLHRYISALTPTPFTSFEGRRSPPSPFKHPLLRQPLLMISHGSKIISKQLSEEEKEEKKKMTYNQNTREEMSICSDFFQC